VLARAGGARESSQKISFLDLRDLRIFQVSTYLLIWRLNLQYTPAALNVPD